MSRRPDAHKTALNRRRMMQLMAATGAASFAGCIGGDDDDDTDLDIDTDEETEGDLLGPDGDQVELEIVYTDSLDAYEDVAEIIAQELEEVGISSNIERFEWSAALSQIVANEYVGDDEPEWNFPNNAGPREETESAEAWDIMYGINFNSYPRTPAAIDAFWPEDGPVNYYGYVPEEDLRSKFSDLRTEPDPEERQSIFNDILLTLNQDQPVSFTVMLDDITGYDERIEGPIDVFGGNWNSQTWYFDDQTVGGDYISAIGGDGETLYFPEIVDTTSSSYVGLTMDGAYAVNQDNEVEPLWLDFTDSGDGQVFVAELRDNLEWGNGYGQMTADDWVYYIDEVQQATYPADEKDNWAQSADQTEWDVVENIERVNDLEFQIELADVNPDFPLEPVLWGSYCAPEGLFEEYRPDGEALSQSEEILELQYTGNLGPYDFVRWDRGASFEVERADDYYMRDADDRGDEWNEAPYFETFTYRVIEEESTRLTALQEGEVHSSGIPERRFTEFDEEVDNVWVNQVPQPFMQIMAMNMRRNGWEQFRTREVRHAVCHLLDKHLVADDIYRGLGEISHTHQPTWSAWWDDSIEDDVQEFGVADDDARREAARALLAEYTDDDYEYSG